MTTWRWLLAWMVWMIPDGDELVVETIITRRVIRLRRRWLSTCLREAAFVLLGALILLTRDEPAEQSESPGLRLIRGGAETRP